MAAGDLTFTTAKTISVPGLQLSSLYVTSSRIDVTFIEPATGATHTCSITDASATGFDYSGGVITDAVARAVSGEFTKLLGLLFKAGAKTTLTQTLITDGILTASGTVA